MLNGTGKGIMAAEPVPQPNYPPQISYGLA